jgi:hypothetical protein
LAGRIGRVLNERLGRKLREVHKGRQARESQANPGVRKPWRAAGCPRVVWLRPCQLVAVSEAHEGDSRESGVEHTGGEIPRGLKPRRAAAFVVRLILLMKGVRILAESKALRSGAGRRFSGGRLGARRSLGLRGFKGSGRGKGPEGKSPRVCLV